MVRNRRIRLADHRGRDATVALVPIVQHTPRHWQDAQGRPVRHVRRVKAMGTTHFDALAAKWPDPDDLSRVLIDSDPEIDLALAGRSTGPCDRVFLDGDGAALYAPAFMEVRFSPDGVERERRPVLTRSANLVSAAPPIWSGVMLPREEVVRRYALARAYQVVHTNALEFDFLYELATYLDERKSMVQVGSGRRGTRSLVLERNGPSYRGFLDGRVQGDAMRLVLYFAAFELAPREAP